MEKKRVQCGCSVAPTLIFPCSGASDVGEIGDRAARSLTKDGTGKMYCLAGIGGHVNTIIVNTQAAAKILAIDGCPLDCVKKSLQHAGFMEFEHLRITDLGLEKGKSPATEERISLVAERGRSILTSE